MLPNIQKRYDSLLAKRQAMLRQLDTCFADELSFKAGPDKWSAMEALEHLVVIEVHFDNHARHMDVILARVK